MQHGANYASQGHSWLTAGARVVGMVPVWRLEPLASPGRGISMCSCDEGGAGESWAWKEELSCEGSNPSFCFAAVTALFDVAHSRLLRLCPRQ
jgi:hypothetical protein